jgi:hypothetical protein
MLTQPADQILNVIRNPFLNDVVVHRAKLLTDPGLHFASESDLTFSWRCRLLQVHGFPGFRLRFRGRLFDVNWFTRLHFCDAPNFRTRTLVRIMVPLTSEPTR